jgi:aliphatic nitrilase
MGDRYPKFKAAAVQAAPVFMEREASVDKACTLIETAGKEGAKLIALPEVYIPAYPYWVWLMGIEQGLVYCADLYKNSVDVPSEATTRLGVAARKANAYVVIGVNERDNKSLYNTLLFFDDEGNLMGKHRKFKATHAEKIIWGDGDGSTHRVYETKIGRLSGLICGEHTMALPGYTLAAMGEQIHIAAWVGFATAGIPAWKEAFRILSETNARYHAIAYNTYVINVQSVVDQETIDKLGKPQHMTPGGGWTAILAPGTGEIISGPLIDQEGIIYADVDLNISPFYYFTHEATGHYWPKQLSVLFNDQQMTPVRYVSQTAEGTPASFQHFQQIQRSVKELEEKLQAMEKMLGEKKKKR